MRYDGKPIPDERVITEARFGGASPVAMRRPIGHNPTAGPIQEEGVPIEVRTPTQRMGDMVDWLDRDGTLEFEKRNALRRIAGFPILVEEPTFGKKPEE